MRNFNPTIIYLSIFFAFVIYLALSFVISSDYTHDYLMYMKQWEAVLNGMNPWSLDVEHNAINAYGPIHNYLAYLYGVHPNFPRVIFCVLYIITSIYLSVRIFKNVSMDESTKNFLYMTLFLNPLFWVWGLKYGTNDFMTASFIIFGIAFYIHKYDLIAGSLFAFSILLKVYPIAMLPFLTVYRTDRIHIRYKFATAFVITCLFIIGHSYLKWGKMILNPLFFAIDRWSKYLSIFRFLRGELSPLKLFIDNPSLDWLSIYCVLISLVIFYFICVYYRFRNILSSMIAMILSLTFYQVGHHQFYITPVLLLILWIDLDYAQIVKTRFLLTSVYLFIIWIVFTSFLHLLTESFSQTAYPNWREILGLPNFIISSITLILLIFHQYKNRFIINQLIEPTSDSQH